MPFDDVWNPLPPPPPVHFLGFDDRGYNSANDAHTTSIYFFLRRKTVILRIPTRQSTDSTVHYPLLQIRSSIITDIQWRYRLTF
jgi:hypothetical protein